MRLIPSRRIWTVLQKWQYRTIEDGMQQGRDNFLLLRFLAAATVIYGHAPPITGNDVTDLFVSLGWGKYSGEIAVDIFFIVSGFLVTGSWQRRPKLYDFVRARMLRIMPAYMTCILMCAFVIGPAFSTFPAEYYFSAKETWNYLITNLHFGPRLEFFLPGVFSENPTRVINGSIWTLPIEVLMYTCVAGFGVAGGVLLRGTIPVCALAITGAAGIVFAPSLTNATYGDYLRMASLFSLGATCWIWRRWIPINGSFLIGASALAWILRETPCYALALAVCEVIFVFWFSYNLADAKFRLHGFNRVGDYSYGLYLWGFPVQQMLVATSGSESVLTNVCQGIFFSLILASISWHVIEKPALSFKR